jgi:hypothetical protein
MTSAARAAVPPTTLSTRANASRFMENPLSLWLTPKTAGNLGQRHLKQCNRNTTHQKNNVPKPGWALSALRKIPGIQGDRIFAWPRCRPSHMGHRVNRSVSHRVNNAGTPPSCPEGGAKGRLKPRLGRRGTTMVVAVLIWLVASTLGCRENLLLIRGIVLLDRVALARAQLR